MARKSLGRCRGLTLLELLLGLAITAVIGICSLGLFNASTSGWSTERTSREASVHAMARGRAVIEREVRSALATGYASGYPTSDAMATTGGVLALWANDNLPDLLGPGQPQLGEIRLLEISAEDAVMRLWVPMRWSEMTLDQQTLAGTRLGVDLETDVVYAAVVGADFFVAHVLAGDAEVDVTGGGFAVADASTTTGSVVSYRADYVENGVGGSLRGAVERAQADQKY